MDVAIDNCKLEEDIHRLRTLLNETAREPIKLTDARVLDISKQLDELILQHYKKNSKRRLRDIDNICPR